MAKPEEYGVSVRLVQEDGADLYEARVLELPDVRTYGESYSAAYIGAIEVIKTTQQIFAEKGRSFPEVELMEDDFSGRVTLRMSKSLHRTVHERAQRDGVSLNQWIVEAVAGRIDGGMIATSSVYVASPMRNRVAGNIGIYLQQAQYLTCLGSGANVFFVQPLVEAFAPPQLTINTASPALSIGSKYHG